MASEDKHGGKTLFIRNLPYTATSEMLEKVFSDIGPLKSCFTVGDKETGKCRGFGYVKFTLLDDAQKALKTVKKVGERNIQMMFAKKKEIKKKFGAPKANVDEKGEAKKEEGAKQETNGEIDKKVPEKKEKKNHKKQKLETVPKKGEIQPVNPYNEGKRARLIVRNLSFKCNEKQLQEAFSKYGQIMEVSIPTKAGSSKKLGFGFVQFFTKAEAGMAVKGANGKLILDRKVAVDFTLPREMYEKKVAEMKSKPTFQEVGSDEEDMEVEQASADEEQKETDEEEEDMSDDGQAMKNKAQKTSAHTNNHENDEEDDDSDEDDSGSGDEDDDGSDDEDENGDEIEDSEDDYDDEDDSENDNRIEKKNLKRKRESDVSEGKTVFIRNLPFNITEEELEDYFSTFGDVNYGRIVLDHESGMSRGTAFVQFKNPSSAEECLNGGSTGTHELGGRELSVTLAVTRDKAVELVGKKDKPKEQKDSRNLYLIREGMIRPGTDQAKDVPAGDLVRRQKIDAQKRKKLKEQDVFVSSTRICIHNLPTSVADKQLRTLVLKAAGDKKAKLIESRIMRDLNRVNPDGVAKSRGYAFCAFSQHEHALAVLRNLNNNAETFGASKRPIVEFSLESRKALEVKQKRFEKSQLKQRHKQAIAPKTNTKPETKKKKQNFKQKANAQPLEVRKQQDKVARSLYKGSIGLPSHSGPKQRHKSRNVEANTQMKKKPNFIKMAQQPRQRESHKIPKELKQKSRRQKPDTDTFDKMVASYKKNIVSSGGFS